MILKTTIIHVEETHIPITEKGKQSIGQIVDGTLHDMIVENENISEISVSFSTEEREMLYRMYGRKEQQA